jgi:hypothetical protein
MIIRLKNSYCFPLIFYIFTIIIILIQRNFNTNMTNAYNPGPGTLLLLEIYGKSR